MMSSPAWIDRLKQKWNITSTLDFILIMLVFSFAGMMIVYERRPLFHLFGISASTPFWIKFVTWLVIVFPAYQLNLIVFGALFGKFDFFWEKEKKLGRFFVRVLLKK